MTSGDARTEGAPGLPAVGPRGRIIIYEARGAGGGSAYRPNMPAYRVRLCQSCPREPLSFSKADGLYITYVAM